MKVKHQRWWISTYSKPSQQELHILQEKSYLEINHVDKLLFSLNLFNVWVGSQMVLFEYWNIPSVSQVVKVLPGPLSPRRTVRRAGRPPPVRGSRAPWTWQTSPAPPHTLKYKIVELLWLERRRYDPNVNYPE